MTDMEKQKAEISRQPTTNGLDDLITDEDVFLGNDGFKLFPQPVAGDQLDPLNWSFAKKHIILAIVMALYV